MVDPRDGVRAWCQHHPHVLNGLGLHVREVIELGCIGRLCAGRPIARLMPYATRREARVLGRDRGSFEVPEDLDDPLPADILEGFLG